jgi:hypothetical protein
MLGNSLKARHGLTPARPRRLGALEWLHLWAFAAQALACDSPAVVLSPRLPDGGRARLKMCLH